MRTLAVSNYKGGVGKTTTDVNRAASDGRTSIQLLYENAAVVDVAYETETENFSVIPSIIELTDQNELMLRDQRLRFALDDYAGDYDIAIIDCSPTMKRLAFNAYLAAADSGMVIIPVKLYFTVMRDFFNLSWDEIEDKGLDDSLKDEVEWAREMDELRHDYRNDEPWKGQRAITFRHYVISPDPSDNIDLEGLRALTHARVRRHFSDYQVAVVYHDDNRQRIPHAHIVVNNTNLDTGRRLHIPNALDMNRSLQEVAKEKGLAAFDNEMPKGRMGRRDPKTPPRPQTRQAVYVNLPERGLLDAGAYSWVSDIRNRVSVAKALSRNEGEFMRILELMEVEVVENSAHAPREDWIFSLADQPSRMVSGERLGMTFGKIALTERFERIGSYHPDAASSRAILSKGWSTHWRRSTLALTKRLPLPLLVRIGNRTHGRGKRSPCSKRRSRAKRKVGWIMKVIKVVFGAIGALCRWLIKAVFKFI